MLALHLLGVLPHQSLALLWGRRGRDPPDALDVAGQHLGALEAPAAGWGRVGWGAGGASEAGEWGGCSCGKPTIPRIAGPATDFCSSYTLHCTALAHKSAKSAPLMSSSLTSPSSRGRPPPCCCCCLRAIMREPKQQWVGESESQSQANNPMGETSSRRHRRSPAPRKRRGDLLFPLLLLLLLPLLRVPIVPTASIVTPVSLVVWALAPRGRTAAEAPR